ncbi:hypothetical protein [Marisediminicola sp. LYQ134]|uniref:hypothetical protein n=1 Tax=unclassified Marisediminicola TaxID=2618316 RepID=UPI003983A166
MSLLVKSALPVWTVVVVGAVLIGVLVEPAAQIDFVTILLAAAIILTFCLQIALVQKEGLVTRIMATVGGSIVLLAIATVVLTLI